jgi:hypothetical protein
VLADEGVWPTKASSGHTRRQASRRRRSGRDRRPNLVGDEAEVDLAMDEEAVGPLLELLGHVARAVGATLVVDAVLKKAERRLTALGELLLVEQKDANNGRARAGAAGEVEPARPGGGSAQPAGVKWTAQAPYNSKVSSQ